ncbi:hypothetical protein [Rhodococcus sp. IEGM 1379]|uniref:hypothetical protein n=1 Tax=Rhodococcus sp. IEGM 1379 TaxID=3047086 RepID=UPI0024B82EF2|nr:hypothetical protein [Rhodococcus sp. IEGM 1379]MDI9918283.1 hypothetical protein [Rhodococcus sp. IEGM 1379]
MGTNQRTADVTVTAPRLQRERGIEVHLGNTPRTVHGHKRFTDGVHGITPRVNNAAA